MSHDLGNVGLMLTTETLLFDTKALTGFCECPRHKSVKPFFIARVRVRVRVSISVRVWVRIRVRVRVRVQIVCNCFVLTSWSKVF